MNRFNEVTNLCSFSIFSRNMLSSRCLIQVRYLQKQKKTIFSSLPSFGSKPSKEFGFSHVVQIGDPVLREVAEEVPKDMIKSEEIKNVISSLRNVVDLYNGVGMAAPQIGVPLKIICVQYTNQQMMFHSQEYLASRGVEPIPQRILINPKMTVLDEEILTFRESCCSMHAFSALVPRYKSIQVRAYNENAEPISWTLKNWPARILQHEIDHLDGKLFVDYMNVKSLSFDYWKHINKRGGDVTVSYRGINHYKDKAVI